MSTSSPPWGNDFTTKPRCSDPSAMRTTAEIRPRSSPANPTDSFTVGLATPSWPGSMIHNFPARTSSALISLSFIGSPTLRNLPRRRTLPGDRARSALRFPRRADPAPVPDQSMGEADPFFHRQKLHQVLLDFLRIVLARQLKSAREALNVGVDDDAGGLAEPGAQDDVRGFSRDSRQFQQLLHRRGHFPLVLLDDSLRRALDAFRLGPEEPGRPHDPLEIPKVGFGEIFRAAVLLEQDRRHQIHS